MDRNVHATAMNEPIAATLRPQGRVEHFVYDLNAKVIINEVQRPGVVEALMIDFLGPQYRVAYWDNSDRKTVWLQASELSSR